jgi:hypothetical protein
MKHRSKSIKMKKTIDNTQISLELIAEIKQLDTERNEALNVLKELLG